MSFDTFFEAATGFFPFAFQRRLATEGWPDIINVETGLGKTAAVVLAWLYRREQAPESTPMRLVWCLPMRSLVEQTAREATKWIEALHDKGLVANAPTVNSLMGGLQDLEWAERPEAPAIIVGTQDMLLSRALMRGYGMSRYAWPIHYAWLHNDALWVFDETQLMGVAITTSAQLQAFRERFEAARPTHSIWMSATVAEDELVTVDHTRPTEGFDCLELGPEDREQPAVCKRIDSVKSLTKSSVSLAKKKTDSALRELAAQVLEAHVDETLTLVIVNRVDRAQRLFSELDKLGSAARCSLLHSRFRPAERTSHLAEILDSPRDRIVVATQVVEAGMDLDATTMFTELAPFPSLVQRFGRCNRRGESDKARIFWVDIEAEEGDNLALPYESSELDRSREIMTVLASGAPSALANVDYVPTAPVRHVIRSRDFVELFDTTPDLGGNDLDVSRYIRDSDDTDVRFYWRDFGDVPPPGMSDPEKDELCAVSIHAASKFAKKIDVYTFDSVTGEWEVVSRLQPGGNYLVNARKGGYLPELGWVGKERSPAPVPVLDLQFDRSRESLADDPGTVRTWQPLTEHLEDVRAEAIQLATALRLGECWSSRIETAAHWHDVGKAHPVFQALLMTPETEGGPPPADPKVVWGKSDHRRGRLQRPFFRHELASALVWLETRERSPEVDAVAYLIAAHHGKVRGSLRALPDEQKPVNRDGLETGQRYARGVWQGDAIGAVAGVSPEHTIDFDSLGMGADSWLTRYLDLLEDVGPFRLAWFESILRLADHRGSQHDESA